nr:hypothetical protein [Nocardioides convexus]
MWDKSARGSHEVRGRTVGIVGYGNIGTQALDRGRGARHERGLLRHRRPARARHRAPPPLAARACSKSPTWSACTSTGGRGTPASSGPRSSRR